MTNPDPSVNPPDEKPRPRIPSTAAELRALQEVISSGRLSTYLRRTHFNARRALELYEWNVCAGAALYPILQVNEIALRNAVNAALVHTFGPSWPKSGGFLRALPGKERSVFDGEIRKLQNKLRGAPVSTGDVVAARTYWFWTFLCTARFQERLWNRAFTLAFPNAPPRMDREIVYRRADAVRRMRNRIAHHEPLLRFDLPGAYQPGIVDRALDLARESAVGGGEMAPGTGNHLAPEPRPKRLRRGTRVS
jgi:hypothetical protein